MMMLWLCVALILIGAQKEAAADVSELSGKWYTVLLASDHREIIEENGSMRMFVKQVDILKNSSLSYIYHIIENGQCAAHELVCDPTEEEGEYSFEYNGHNVFHILDIVSDEYLIYFLKNGDNGDGFHLMGLYGRGPDVRSEIREKYVQLCQEHGIVKENILDLTKTDRCLQARDQA
ncbi:lipocalin Can f 6.0101-like isoform X1 [Ochotona princeps]|uniref:lipocalin Can f 6.0101-like isoform X1 n=1 Tax=Ochotona princeps TaxID=9978 RepID=UPI002714CA0D|nr:lipocalin Can f 6.0101-like isoform X1 [Ochotona princeps]